MTATSELDQAARFGEGDWIVHCSYGLGQIMGIETKRISGSGTRYYRIQTSDSTYWLPVTQSDSEELRPLASQAEIQAALAILAKPPRKMASNHTARKSRIQQVRSDNTPDDIARLVRDLRARQRDKGILNQTERSAYGTFKQRLLEEWAAVSGSQLDLLAARLEALLNPQVSSAD